MSTVHPEPPPRTQKTMRALMLALCLLGAGTAVVAGTTPDCPPAAQAPTVEQLRSGMKSARDRGFLWRIRKDGRSSYLYGTVHLGRFEWLVPGAAVMDAVRSSDLIALEIDMLDPDIMARMQAGMAPRPGGVISSALADRLKAQLKAACLPEALLGSMAPEMVATTLVAMSARRQGLDPAYGIDVLLAGLGHGMKKTVASLETPELQLAVLLGETPPEMQAVVEQALDELESGRAMPTLLRLAQVWDDGRFDEFEKYPQWCDCLGTDEERALHKRLLDDRNPALAERIDALHRSGKQVFAAVGSLHMIGPQGLPALLARRGYQVERIASKP